MKIFARVIIAFVIVITFNRAALPWGNAPSHCAISNDVIQNGLVDGQINNEELFIRANACPDIANTQLFKYFGLTFVHSLEFAESVYEVAAASSRAKWLDTAYAWGAHLSADGVIHLYLTYQQPVHQLTELAIDTVIYYEGSPLYTELEWEQYNAGTECCSPWLIYLASRHYRNSHPGARLIYPWLVRMALDSLRTTINVEYGYIKAKGDAELSHWFLENIPYDVLNGEWEDHYNDSVDAAEAWILSHP